MRCHTMECGLESEHPGVGVVSAESALRNGWARVYEHQPGLVGRWTQRLGRVGQPPRVEGLPMASIRKQLLPTFLTGEFADPSSLLNRARYRSLNHDEARRLEKRIADGAPRIVDALRMIEALEGCSQESPEWAGLFPKRDKQWRTRKFVAETRKRLDGGRSLPATRQEINAVLGEIMERESLRPRLDDLRGLLDDPAVAAELAASLRDTWRPPPEAARGPRAGAAHLLAGELRGFATRPFQTVDATGRETDLPEASEQWRYLRTQDDATDGSVDGLLLDRAPALGLTEAVDASSVRAPVRLRGTGRAPLEWSFEERVGAVLANLPDDYRTGALLDDLRDEVARCAHWTGLGRLDDRMVLLLVGVVVEQAQRRGWRGAGPIDREERRTLVNWLIAVHSRVSRRIAEASWNSVLCHGRWNGRPEGVGDMVDLRAQRDPDAWADDRLMSEIGRVAWRRLHRGEYLHDPVRDDLTALSRDFGHWLNDAAHFVVEHDVEHDEPGRSRTTGPRSAADVLTAINRGLCAPIEQSTGLGRGALNDYLVAVRRCRSAAEPGAGDDGALRAARTGIEKMLRRWRREGVMRMIGMDLTVEDVVAALNDLEVPEAGEAGEEARHES